MRIQILQIIKNINLSIHSHELDSLLINFLLCFLMLLRYHVTLDQVFNLVRIQYPMANQVHSFHNINAVRNHYRYQHVASHNQQYNLICHIIQTSHSEPKDNQFKYHEHKVEHHHRKQFAPNGRPFTGRSMFKEFGQSVPSQHQV